VTGVVRTVNVRGEASTQRTISYSPTGAKVEVSRVRVLPENRVELELYVSDRRLYVAPDGIPIGKDEGGKTIRATEFITTEVNTHLSLPSGHATLVREVNLSPRTGADRTLVVVSVQIIQPEKVKTKKR
jgi:hypothetical protein